MVLVNPEAGHGRSMEERARRALERAGINGSVEAPRGVEAMVAAVDRGVGEGYDRFAAVGGDGTVNCVVEALLAHSWDTPPKVGILPGGSGCDLARTFGIPERIEEAVVGLTDGREHPIDVAELSGPWGRRSFVNVGEAGLTAAVLRRSMQLPRSFRAWKYHVSLAIEFPRFPAGRVRFESDAGDYEGPALLAVFANARFFAGGWNIAPSTDPSDRRFQVQIFDVGKRDIPRLWWLAKDGRHLADRRIHVFEPSVFRVAADPVWPVEADGEFFGSGPVEGRFREQRITIVG